MNRIPLRARGLGLVVALGVLTGSASAQQARVGSDSATQHVTELEYGATTADHQPYRSSMSGASSTTIELDSLAPKPLGSFSNVLSSRIPGMLVEQSSGAAGAGARIHIRGINSLLVPGDPLVLVDGVRVANSTTFTTADVGGQVPSRLDAIDPEQIERIEVLPGPASAAMYGGDAANGVILITTRHGQPGRPVWRLHTQYGVMSDVTDYPMNFGRIDTTPAAGLFTFPCSLDREYQGACVPGSLTWWNPLARVSPFHTGTQQRYGLSVSGGSPAITYNVAADYDREDGVYSDNSQRQTHLRAAVTDQLSRTLDLALTFSYVDGRTRLPIGGTRYSGFIGISVYRSVIADGLFGAAADDPVTRGYADSLSTVLTGFVGTPEGMHQSTFGTTVRWQPSAWLQSTNTIGLDRVHLSSSNLDVSPNVFGSPSPDSVAERNTQVYHSSLLSVQSDWQASYGGVATLSGGTSIGLHYNRQRVHHQQEMADVVFSGGTRPPLVSTASSEFSPDASTIGLSLQQRFAWRDRIVVTGGLRRDRIYHALFSPASKIPAVTDLSASLSWSLSSEPFFPQPKWLDALRLRAAYGRTGRDFQEVMLPPDVMLNILLSTPALPAFSRPEPVLPIPERTREVEVGLDMELLDGRVNAALTYVDHRSSHLTAILPAVDPASSAQAGPQLRQDAAAMHNRGYEMMLSASLLRTHALSWDIAVAGSTDRNTLEDYGAPPMRLSRAQRVVSGYATPGYWSPRFMYADANGDGIISRDEVQLDDTASFLGSAVPSRELAIAPTLIFFGRSITLSALFDYRGGFMQYDANEAYRCANPLASTCRAAEDASAPLADQAAAIASILGSDAGYIDDATFWKLREVAVSFTAPHQWAAHLAASDMRFTLAGRNLATWTRYPGLDPEINATPYDPLVRSDFATQPPVRYFTARVDVTW